MKYRTKTVVIEAVTFDEFVKQGIAVGGNVVNGMPWSFNYSGQAITHDLTDDDDDCYLIPTLEGEKVFTRNDILIICHNGELSLCRLVIFEKTYEVANDDK